MLKYKLKKMSKRKLVVWSTIILLFSVSMFSIVRYYALSTNLKDNWNGKAIDGEIVYVNDLETDWNYYIGLNYTEVTNKSVLPGENSTEKYNSDSLVAVQLTYDGHDVNDNNLVGLVSNTERQHTFVYYKYYPIVNGKIKIELIDNPYMARPTGKGFNGWVCDKDSTIGVPCENMTFSFDDNYYLRYVEIDAPKKDENGDKKLIINLKASWINADIKTSISDKTSFKDKSMQQITFMPIYKAKTTITEYDCFDGGEQKYYKLEVASRGSYYSGFISSNNDDLNNLYYDRYDIYSEFTASYQNGTCYTTYGCPYFRELDNDEELNEDGRYFAYDEKNGKFKYVEDTSSGVCYTKVVDDVLVGYDSVFKDGDSTTGYYKKVSSYSSLEKAYHYNESGMSCDQTSCNSSTFKLIQSTDAGSTIDYENELDSEGNVILSDDGTPVIKPFSRINDYYYLVTRDTNILNLSTNTTISNLSSTRPYTITSAYNDVNYNASAYITNTSSGSSFALTLGDDLVIENIQISGLSESNTNSRGNANSISSGNYNLKISRGIRLNGTNMTAYGVVGGVNNKVIVQSGKFRYLKVLPTSDTTNNHVLAEYGNDYDRILNNNLNLIVTFQALSYDNGNHNADNNSIIPVSEMIIKSGTYGNYMYNSTGNLSGDSYYTYGIYAGGISGGSSNAYKILKVEGGRIFCINGGPVVSTNINGNAIGIYVTGGVIDNLTGGAGKSTTYGNRLISVTGGKVNNAVSGGSNSYEGSGTDGTLSASTLVYIGGNSHIGGTPSRTNSGGKLFAVEAGSVFGAGLGRSSSTNAGTVYNSHVIINGGTIDKDVYGGGNYGSTGTQLNSETNAKVELLAGTINGSVFGGANSANGGYTNDNSGSYTSVLAKDYYYLSNVKSYEYVDNTYDISRTCSRNGYEVRINSNNCQYYQSGFFGGWQNYSTGMSSISTSNGRTSNSTDFNNIPQGSILLDGTIVDKNIVCNADVGEVSTTNGNNSDSWQNVNSGNNSVTQNGTRIRRDTTTYTCSYINLSNIVKKGSIVSNNTDREYYERLEDGSFRKVDNLEYEGSAITNDYKHSVDILLDGATINGSVYGGSNTTGTIYGNINIDLLSGSVQNADNGVYGGGKGQNTQVRGHTDVETKAEDDNLLKIYDIYGGSENGSVNGSSQNSIGGDTKISINGGTINNVYGGGKGPNYTPYTYGPISVTLNDGIVTNIFGGNNIRGAVNSTNNPFVIINGGIVDTVYGGSNGENASAQITRVIVNGGRINEALYGGGKKAPTTGSSNITINGGVFAIFDERGYAVGNPATIYGGGEEARVTTTNVNIENGANVYDVFGGSNLSGVVTTSNVNNNGGNIFCNSYGGGNIATVTTSNNNLNGSLFNYEVHEGESLYGSVCGNAFGGGKSANVENANVKLNGSTLINVYGGSNQDGVVSKVKIEAIKGTAKTIFGGNNAGGSTGDSYISYNQSGDTLNVDNVFGGPNGRGATTTNSTYIQMLNGIVKEDIFGGGNEAKVLGSTIVNMYGGTVRNIYGGGNSSFVGDANEVSGAFVSGIKEGSTKVNVINGNVLKNVYGSGNSSFVYGKTNVNIGNKGIDDIKSIGTLPVGTVYNPDSVSKNIVINGSVFGGSETNADESTKFDYSYNGVIGDATINVDGTSYGNNLRIDGSLFGSGNNSATSGITKLFINKYGLENSPNTSTSIQRFMDVYITDSYIELNGDKDRANGKPYKYSLVRLDNLYVLGSMSTNDTLNGSELYLVSGSTYLKSIYSGTMNGAYNEENFVAQTTSESENGLINGNANNKIYMYSNKVLSISNSEEPSYDASSTPAGSVHGMSFLGMYTHQASGPYVKGIYDSNLSDGTIVSDLIYSEINSSSYTFVYGKHDYDAEQQIKTNGYYSNYVDEETKKLSVDYVGVTPLNALYYKWTIGDEPTDIVVNLQATRYSVDGAVNKTIDLEELREEIVAGNSQEWRDATMKIYEVDTSAFGARAPDVKTSYDTYLVDKTNIPFFNLDDDNGDGIVDSNQMFALSMGTTTAGWKGNYKTNFYDRDGSVGFGEDFCEIGSDGDCVGDSMYIYDSTTVQRSLSFWLYHSKNLDFSVAGSYSEDEDIEIPLGTVYIRSEFTNVHGDPTDATTTRPVRIVVNISMYEGSDDAYGKAISPGKKYEVFSNRPTAIASDGSFSIFQSLSLDLTADVLGTNTGEKWDVNKVYNKAYTTIDKEGQLVEVSEAYRYLRSSYVFPIGTHITMLDMIDGEQYYYNVDEENYNKVLAESQINKGDAKYRLEDFIKMGCTDPNNKYDDDMNGEDSTKYRHLKENYDGTMNDLAIEEFIFTVDFSGVSEEDRTKTEIRPYLYMLLSRDENGVEKKILGPTGIPDTEMSYTIHPYVDTIIESSGGYIQEDGSITPETIIYYGHTADLQINTNLIQTDKDGNVLNNVADTIYDDYKLGARITVLRAKTDSDGNEVIENGEVVYRQITQSLFGTVFSINGKNYYPQTDGSTVLELSGRITDVISNINIDFGNSSLDSRTYKLVVETFASYDGLYFGDADVTYNEFIFELLNDQYGLDVKVPDNQIIHDVNTGQDKEGNRQITYSLDVKTGLANPNLKISLLRRDYDDIYTNSYDNKDLKDLADEVYMEGYGSALTSCYMTDDNGNCIYYNLGNITNSNSNSNDNYVVKLTLKNGPSQSDLDDKVDAKWKSGTYRVVFTIFDGDVVVGEVYEYIIIRSLGIDEEVEGS